MAQTERIISLVHTIAADPALIDRLAATPKSDRGAILTELGYGDVSIADLVGSASLLAPDSVEEIDDEQLASVAGGGGDEYSTTTAGVSCFTCAT